MSLLSRMLYPALLLSLSAACSGGDDDSSADDAGGGDTGDAGEVECLPTNCSELGVVCGPVDDGCGATLECGGCGEQSCVQGQCISTDCGEGPVNACGGCETLAAGVGDSCNCEGLVTECNEFGTLSCADGNNEGSPTLLPDTDDDVDLFTDFSGTLSSVSGDPLDFDRDVAKVHVDDTTFAILDAALEIDYNTETPTSVRIEFELDSPLLEGDLLLNCSSGVQSDTKVNFCQLLMPAGIGTFSIDTSINFMVPNPGDDSGIWSIILTQAGDAGTNGSCDSYTVRYRF